MGTPKKENALEPAQEAVFSSPSCLQATEESRLRVKREDFFEEVTGMHSSYDQTIRYDFQMKVTQITYQVETVTDPRTGKSVRASTDGEGPAGLSLTWGAIVTLLKMHAGFAAPIHRLSLMLGHPAFQPSRIYRSLEWSAQLLLPIYLHLPEQLAEAEILSGDDTSTKVLDTTEEPQAEGINLHRQVDELLGWCSNRADGKGKKKALNVTLISGRTESDPRSTIRFFRTHVGSFGNLVSRLLEMRSPRNKKIIIQGDLSSSNLPEKGIRDRFEIQVSGCGAHARRPIWRYRKDDPDFCYYLLSAFLLLSYLEKLIDLEGRTEENVRKYRRYAGMLWQAIRNRCLAAITGVRTTPFTDAKHKIIQWPPQNRLHVAAQYIVDHFQELTLYLQEPRLPWTTNDQERGLRFEKCLLGAAKFKGNRNGRVILDILRTLNATSASAQVEMDDYIQWVYRNRGQVEENPGLFTPFAYAKFLDSVKNKGRSPPAPSPSGQPEACPTLQPRPGPGSVQSLST